MKRLPILVFDLDGTLSDPFEGIWRSTNHALAGFGHPPVARETFHRFIGPPIDQTFATLVSGVGAAAIAALVRRFRERYGELGYAENEMYPGIRPLLDGLVEAGFTCGICTAKRRDFAEMVLGLFELERYFSFVEGGDVGIRKTDQLHGLRSAGTIDVDAIMIGDRATDLTAASANGLRGVGVTWGYGDRPELEDAAPWAIVDSPDSLFDLLAREHR